MPLLRTAAASMFVILLFLLESLSASAVTAKTNAPRQLVVAHNVAAVDFAKGVHNRTVQNKKPLYKYWNHLQEHFNPALDGLSEQQAARLLSSLDAVTDKHWQHLGGLHHCCRSVKKWGLYNDPEVEKAFDRSCTNAMNVGKLAQTAAMAQVYAGPSGIQCYSSFLFSEIQYVQSVETGGEFLKGCMGAVDGHNWNLATLVLLVKQASFSGLRGAQYDKLIKCLGVMDFLKATVDEEWFKVGIPNWLDHPGATRPFTMPWCGLYGTASPPWCLISSTIIAPRLKPWQHAEAPAAGLTEIWR